MLKLKDKFGFKSYLKRNSQTSTNQSLRPAIDQSSIDQMDVIIKKDYKYNIQEFYDKVNKRIELLEKQGKSAKTIMIDANLSRSSFDKLKNYPEMPNVYSKRNVIKLAIGLELNYTETLELLHLCDHSLAQNSKFDMICRFFFQKWKYLPKERGKTAGLITLEELLLRAGQESIMKEKGEKW